VELEEVSVGPRAVAVVIDTFLLSIVVGIPLTVVFGHRAITSAPGVHSVSYSSNDPAVWQVGAVITLAYFILFEAAFGATIGKMILHLRVRALDGTRIGWWASIIRNVGRIVDAVPFFVPYLLGAIAIWADGGRRRQRLADHFAHTVVVHGRARPSRREFESPWEEP
jgi:uncharacterized RDD family membrane protein YckC